MVTISGLSKRYGAQVILDGVDWFIPRRARIALVGANGSGKSTLLRILAGQVEPDGGRICFSKGVDVGYLAQEIFDLGERTVLEEALEAFADAAQVEQRCRELEELLATTDPQTSDYDALFEEYARVREQWDTQGSYDQEARARAVLSGLGFSDGDLSRPCREFSGGWQMRIALAKLLLRQPGLLLLDEPTNHLDLEARNWLEDFLLGYPHSVVLVAHDRFFMDACCTQVTEICRGKLSDYECSYSEYLAQREERIRQQEEAYRLQQEEIARIQGFINRFRYQASKAALVQSRIKQLEKMQRVEPAESMRTVRFRFPVPPRSGRVVLQLQGVSKFYGEKCVYANLELTLERGRKVALVGPNGAGKSTLMRILAGVEPPDTGQRWVGHNVSISYFAQDRRAGLAENKSVLDVTMAHAPAELVPQLRTLLGAFLFSGDSVYKPVRVLSGGERSRLALALLLLRPSNCLLLDEPTNHLDLGAKEVLLEALRDYEGTLVFVAHDRYFLDQLPDEIWEVGRGSVVRYLGNYEDYLAKKAAGNELRVGEDRQRAVAVERNERGFPPKTKGKKKGSSRPTQRETLNWAKEIADIEATIASKEAELEALRRVISEPDFYEKSPNPRAHYSAFAELQREIEMLYDKLEKLEHKRQVSMASGTGQSSSGTPQEAKNA
ncbi:MAG: ABC transporter ATP-binding protein [Candidatus Binatia bacterium]|nr:MAG: ABC transporter ATP-binding protein [Candidatus Binatia bacterium]